MINVLKEIKPEDITGELIKEYRESKTPKMTQQELADKLGVKQQSLARWESTGRISIIYKRFIAEYFKENWKE